MILVALSHLNLLSFQYIYIQTASHKKKPKETHKPSSAYQKLHSYDSQEKTPKTQERYNVCVYCNIIIIVKPYNIFFYHHVTFTHMNMMFKRKNVYKKNKYIKSTTK